jgi:hypothetical protein
MLAEKENSHPKARDNSRETEKLEDLHAPAETTSNYREA